jgi:hypothetical protein
LAASLAALPQWREARYDLLKCAGDPALKLNTTCVIKVCPASSIGTVFLRIFLVTIFVFPFVSSFAGLVTGTVKDENGNLLPYASISVQASSKGAITNGEGKYSINLPSGNYVLICQYVGFKREEKNIVVNDEPILVDFVLSIQQIVMQEVIIKRGPDPALEIIRNTIRKRDFYNKQVDSFKVDVYLKSLVRSRNLPDRVMGQKVDKEDMKGSGLDSLGRGILFLSESQTKVSFKKPDNYKYEVVSSRQSGGGYGFGLPMFINFNVNNVDVFGRVNPRGFISPIADGAFHYYKFHYDGSFFENNKMIDRIKVTPKRKNEPLFDGYIQIVDGEWRLHSVNLKLTKDYQLQLVDTTIITQMNGPISQDIWRTQNQVVYLASNTFGFEWTGYFLNVYSNYNLSPGFSRKSFDRIILSYDTAFNKKDSVYWNNVRPFPLDSEEVRDFVYKDSLYRKIKDSMFSKQRLDTLNNTQPPISLERILITGIHRFHYSKKGFLDYKVTPLILSAQYNTVEGFSADIQQFLHYSPRQSSKEFYLDVSTRYGFNNNHFNAFGVFGISPQMNYYNHYLEFSGGKRVLQFNHDNPIDEFTNTYYTLLVKKNFMKIYENWFGQIKYNSSSENGWKWNIASTFEDRIPVENTTDYSFGKKYRTILPNHPYELANVPFTRHQALVTSFTVSYQPGQYYIQMPDSKFSVGSKYPTFELFYSKGIKDLLNSDVDFDKWKFSVYDDMNFKMAGEFKYRISGGGFINSSHVEIPDFTHFNGNQTYRLYNKLNGFQLAPYYQYSNIAKLYGELHVEHHFNGLITNKIPLLNKLKWNLVGGTNSFYVNSGNYYVEAFAGIENIFKMLRIDFITASHAAPANIFGVRFGFGGILGNAIELKRNSIH